jgi:hypothetical protein
MILKRASRSRGVGAVLAQVIDSRFESRPLTFLSPHGIFWIEVTMGVDDHGDFL